MEGEAAAAAPSAAAPPSSSSDLAGAVSHKEGHYKYGAVMGWDGTHFRGWQLQGADPRLPWRGRPRTVQGAVERAWSEALYPSLDPESRPVTVMSAGRTDVGVHALAMPLHVWTPECVGDLEAASKLVAAAMPDDLWTVRLALVPKDFDAKAGVQSKTYRYQMWDGEEAPPARLGGTERCWWLANRRPPAPPGTPRVPGKDARGPVPAVDVGAMRACAGASLVQTREFSGLSAPSSGISKAKRKARNAMRERGEEPGPKHKEDKMCVRTIFRCDVDRTEGHLVTVEVEGSGFLYKMVRLIASLLFEVGAGLRTLESAEALVARADSHATVQELRPAPPQGLCLVQVRYADDHPGADVMNPPP